MPEKRYEGVGCRIVMVALSLPAGFYALFLTYVIGEFAYKALQGGSGIWLVLFAGFFALLAMILFYAAGRAIFLKDPRKGLFAPGVLKLAGGLCLVLSVTPPALAAVAGSSVLQAIWVALFFAGMGFATIRIARAREKRQGDQPEDER